MPVSGSLGRSSLQFSVGGRSKIASLVSCGVLIILTLIAGPVLAVLPKALLACIIIVNLRRLLCQITETDKLSFFFLPQVSDWSTNENKSMLKTHERLEKLVESIYFFGLEISSR